MNEFLDSLAGEIPQAWPEAVLTDPITSDVVVPMVEIEPANFSRRFEASEYLFERIGSMGIPDLERDKGLWAWLALLWFEQLCPAGKGGIRNPGARARWIPAVDDARRYYRHLLLGPYAIYRRYSNDPEKAFVLLAQSLGKPGDVVEQLASRQDLVNCDAVIGTATALYCDEQRRIKRGAGGKLPGSARRLAEVLVQFDLTFDLQSLSVDGLMALLPREFDRWAPP